MGSWKIIEIFSPLIVRISSFGTLSRSWPWKKTSPEMFACLASISPITVRELTLLPEPDSPTMPSVSPACSE
jgi:hypothetical protein